MESNSNKFLHKNKIIIKITEISHQFCTWYPIPPRVTGDLNFDTSAW
jgi:hypothetical protein